MRILVFSGHRPDGIAAYPGGLSKLWNDITCYLENNRPDQARCSMAMGFDLMCAHVCYELGIPYTAYLPFAAQVDRFPWEWQERHGQALDRAADVVLCADMYYEGCLLDMNISMLAGSLPNEKENPDRRATAVLACMRPGTKKGDKTRHCLDVSKKMKIPTTVMWS